MVVFVEKAKIIGLRFKHLEAFDSYCQFVGGNPRPVVYDLKMITSCLGSGPLFNKKAQNGANRQDLQAGFCYGCLESSIDTVLDLDSSLNCDTNSHPNIFQKICAGIIPTFPIMLHILPTKKKRHFPDPQPSQTPKLQPRQAMSQRQVLCIDDPMELGRSLGASFQGFERLCFEWRRAFDLLPLGRESGVQFGDTPG